MILVEPNAQHLSNLSTWFTDEKTLLTWTGPNFRYPYTLATFTRDLNLAKLHSYVLINEHDDLIGFGQFYIRLNRCHLARLVINPSYRGRGLAKMLVSRLCDKAKSEFEYTGYSLFVLADNIQALQCYQNYGFLVAEYPEILAFENCLYLIKN